MKQQLYRSLTPVSTAATVATSPEISDVASDLNSNHTYEPIETAAQAFSAHGDYSSAASNIPVTLIHHDGRRVTANKITSLDTLRETLHAHEQLPYDDPENRGDLYILAPMRLLTPIIEETDSELTRNKIYQELSTVSRSSAAAADYSCVDNSIMSIISEVLSVRNVNQSKISLNQTNTSDLRFLTGCENIFDTNCLLSTIEEHRAQPRAEERLSFAWPSFSNSSKPPAFAVQSAAVNLVKELMQSKSVVILQDGGAPRPG